MAVSSKKTIGKKKTTIWVTAGSITILGLLSLLFLLPGVKVESNGDITCASNCTSYFNVTTKNDICFNVTSIIQTDPITPTKLFYKSGSTWKLFNPMTQCITKGKTEFMLTGNKKPMQDVKWGVPSIGLDPYWKGEPGIYVNIQNAKWEILKNENSNVSVAFSNKTKKDTQICFTDKDDKLTKRDITDKADKKIKSITKSNGKYCISTNETYFKFNPEVEYQNSTSLIYENQFSSTEITAFCNISNQWTQMNDLFYNEITGKIKWGYNGQFNDITNCKIVLTSTAEILPGGTQPYILNPEMFWTKEYAIQQKQLFDFDDIGSRAFECSEIVDPEFGPVQTCNKSAQLTIGLSKKIIGTKEVQDIMGNRSEQVYEYSAIAEFFTDGFIDPTITYSTADTFTSALLNNITVEAGASNYSHLTINNSNLIGYWSFDGDTSKAYDLSGNNNDGSLIGDAKINSTGKYGSASWYDGVADGINLPDSDSLVLGNNFTIGAWVYPRSFPLYSSIFKSWDSTLEVYYASSSGTPTLYVSSNGVNYANIDAGYSISTGTWTYMAVTFNAGNISHYKNGVLINSGTCALTSVYNSNNAKIIGAKLYNGVYAESFNGSIDEVMVFNKSLTPAEITAIYNNQSGRFFKTGSQEIVAQNITKEINRVNITTTAQTNFGSNLSAQIGYWNITKGYNNTDMNATAAGLVSYYHLDGTPNDAMGRNNGTALGISYPSGVYNQSVQVNATWLSQIYIADSASLDSMTPYISVSAWVYANSIQGAGGLNHIISKYGDAGDEANEAWTLRLDAGVMKTYVNIGGNWYSAGTQTLSTGQWYFVTGTYDNVTIKTYVNGVLAGSTAQAGTIKTSNDYVRIGKAGDLGSTNGYWWNGTIDEVMLFNRSLSANEIRELYVKSRANFQYTAEQNLTSNTNSTFTIPAGNDRIVPKFNFYSDGFYTPYLTGTPILGTYNVTETAPPSDNEYPIFSSYWDNNGSLIGSGIGKFNVTVTSTNGTVLLEINGTNVTTSNLSSVFNATYSFTSNNTYPYKYCSWGNGTSHNFNCSSLQSYTVLPQPCSYTGGNWNPPCTCTISSPVNLNRNNISIVGSGTFKVQANIYNYTYMNIQGNATGRCLVLYSI